MPSVLSTETISLRQKRGSVNGGTPHEESSVLLSAKLSELFTAGYERDEIFGIVIPLLMQGKIRINRGNDTERLEIEDKDLRLQRTAAIQIFENYLLTRDIKSTVLRITPPQPRE